MCVVIAVVCGSCGDKPVDTLRVTSKDGDLACLVSIAAPQRHTAERPLCVDARDYFEGSEKQFVDPRDLVIGECVLLWDAHPTYGLTPTGCPASP
jgi:hypothetical protein